MGVRFLLRLSISPQRRFCFGFAALRSSWLKPKMSQNLIPCALEWLIFEQLCHTDSCVQVFYIVNLHVSLLNDLGT